LAKQNGQAQQQTQLASRNPVDAVAERVRHFVEQGQLHLPPGYSAENALKAAWLMLQEVKGKNNQPALEVATKASVYNALLNMVVQALNPVKRQCYFIMYGQTLVCQRSYYGDMAIVKRVVPGADIWYGVVYEGDVFEYSINRGKIVITKHEQKLENIDPKKIKAAYCVIERDGEVLKSEIMTMAQIRQSWLRSQTYKPEGEGTPHHTEPDQMAIRTVVRRACKALINSASDDYLFLQHYNQSDIDAAEAAFEAQVWEEANSEVIDVEPEGYSISDVDPEIGEIDAEAEAEQAEAEVEQATLAGPGF